MPSRANVDLFRAALDAAVKAAQAELAQAFTAMQHLPREMIRDGMIEVFESVAVRYGDQAAAAAADFYELLRPTPKNALFQAVLAEPVRYEQAESTVRYAADHLWSRHPDKMLSLLDGHLQRYVENTARDTIHLNARIDPTRPRWARVPAGGKTCAWCLMLASRGWVYETESSAGGKGNDFHNDDRCMIVPSWEKHPKLDGYDPDAMFEKYMAARLELIADGVDPSDEGIVQRLRDMFPGDFTDGAKVPSILRDVSLGWPAHIKPPTAKIWRHVQERHAPGGTAVDTFPDHYTPYDIAKFAREVAANPDVMLPHRFPGVLNLYKEIDDVVYVVGTSETREGLAFSTVFPPSKGGGILEAWNSWKDRT